jgi:hypothetical protein
MRVVTGLPKMQRVLTGMPKMKRALNGMCKMMCALRPRGVAGPASAISIGTCLRLKYH